MTFFARFLHFVFVHFFTFCVYERFSVIRFKTYGESETHSIFVSLPLSIGPFACPHGFSCDTLTSSYAFFFIRFVSMYRLLSISMVTVSYAHSTQCHAHLDDFMLMNYESVAFALTNRQVEKKKSMLITYVTQTAINVSIVCVSNQIYR